MKQQLVLVFLLGLLITLLPSTLAVQNTDDSTKLRSDVFKLAKFATVYDKFSQNLQYEQKVSQQHMVMSNLSDITPWYQNFLTCAVCKSLVGAITEYVKDAKNVKAMEGAVGLYCYMYQYGNDTCVHFISNVATQYMDWAFTLALTPEYFCTQYFPTCTPEYEYLTTDDYITDMLSDKPSTITSNNYIQGLYDGIFGATGRSTYTILHLSDFNIDYDYQTGASTDCGEYLCCRTKYGTGTSGTYGDLSCGTPIASFNALIDSIQTTYTPDIVFVTGGMLAPDLSLSNTTVMTYLNNTLKALKTQFPSTQVFFALGEEEFLPTFQQNFSESSSYRTTNISASLQYGLGTINTTAANETSEYGYYSVHNLYSSSNINTATLTTTMLLSLNTQACYTYNLALMQEMNDTADQLTWLESKLAWAATNSWTAFIIGHIPPGSELCNRQWNERYHAIMERYQHIVRLQAFGHSKTDSFKIQRSHTSSTPFQVMQIGGNSGTYNYNPSARLYYMDASLHIPTQIKVFNFPVSSASSTWAYTTNTYPDDYSMDDLSPSQYSSFVSSILSSSTTANTFISDMTKGTTTTCDSTCQQQLYCDLNYGLVEKTLECRDNLMDFQYYLPYLLSTFENPWVKYADD